MGHIIFSLKRPGTEWVTLTTKFLHRQILLILIDFDRVFDHFLI